MLLLNTFALATVFVVYRVLVLGLPFFTEAVRADPVPNILCGVASDLSLAVLLAGLALTVTRWKLPRWAAWASTVVTALAVAAVAAHMRYVVHFGMTVRPYHLATLTSGEVVSVGAVMVFQSWRADLLLGLGAAGILLAWWKGEAVEAWWRTRTKRQARTAYLGALGAAVALHSAMLNLRILPRIHGELRYNVFEGLYYSYVNYAKWKTVPVPKPEELAQLRGLLPGKRAYGDGEQAKAFPLWQEQVATREAAGESAALRRGLRRFVAEGTRADGPWNVVLVISESLRAREIGMMGDAPPDFAGLMPNLARIAADGVKFTGMLNTGFATHFGQTAAYCSVFGAKGFTILNGAPFANATCLGDVFEKRGYDTSFFYPANNLFDNQGVFYRFHRVKHVYDENDFPPGGAMGGWGHSDHALFELVMEKLKGTKAPYFATVMTLSNHGPDKLPDDAPETIDRTATMQKQLLQYVDWSTALFYDRVMKELPHTIFLLVADHGRFMDDLLKNDLPASEILRRTSRIPFVLVVPGAPVALKGQTVARLGSNIDVPPTLLTLLSWENEPQQFMGMDLFSREGPVYMDFQNTLLEVDKAPEGPLQVREVPPELEDLLGAAARFDRLAPPTTRRADDKRF